MKMDLLKYNLAISRSKPWICRKLCKSSVLICVIVQWLQLTSANNTSQNHSSQLIPDHDRTPRSIDAKLRVFKYVTEDQTEAQLQKPLNFNLQEIPTESKTSAPISPNVPRRRKQRPKPNLVKQGSVPENSTIIHENEGVGFDPVLKSSNPPTVTDRSLIPNSFFVQTSDSDGQKQTVKEQPVKNHGDNNHTQKYGSGSHHTKPRQHQHLHEQNGNQNNGKVTDGYSSKSSASGTGKGMQASEDNSVAQNRNASSNKYVNHDKTQDYTEVSFNATLLLSERPRRSPFGARNRNNNFNPANPGGRVIYQNHMPIMHQNMERRTTTRNKNGGPFGRKMVQNGKRSGNKGKLKKGNNGRAALFNRNPSYGIPGVLMAIPHQNMQNVGNNQFNNQNMNRGVAMVVPPNLHQKLDPIQPSPSSNFVQYQNLGEPTWNHPMYQRYYKAAKNMQSKVSTFMGRPPSNRVGDGFRSEFSKIPPIPLPRPRPGHDKPGPPRGVRSRPGPGPPPPGRYSYPKSAQSIQDILNHFQGGQNHDIMNDVEGPGPKGEGSRYPTKRRPEPNRDRDRDRHQGPPQPGSIADLSSELTDVKFSLLRDIREFAKRPMNMGESDRDDYPPDRHNPIIPLRSPPSQKPPRRREYPDEEEDSWRKSPKNKKYSSSPGDPFAPDFNHEDGFDEIFNPKPKPVRELIAKKSSRFRQPGREEEKEDEFENHYSRKKSTSDFEDSPYYHSQKDKHKSDLPRYGGEASEHEDSTERSFKGSPSSPFFSSVEIEIDRHGGQRHSHRNRDRDRDHSRHRPDNEDRSYLSSYEAERVRRPHYHDRNRDRDRDYPKSIRDKLKEVHNPPPQYDYDSEDHRDYKHSPKIPENKPLVLKRPYEPYPPPSPGGNKWANYASATEKSLYGYTNPSNLNYNVAPSLPPPPLPQLSPHHNFQLHPPITGMDPGTQNRYHLSGDDILEIHTGQRYPAPVPSTGIQPPPPPYSPPDQNDAHSLHKAYLELLQQKMNSDQALANNPQLPPPVSSTTRKTPTPMRMKIHIYPNAEHTEPQPTPAPPQSNPGLGSNTNANQNPYGHNQMTQYHLPGPQPQPPVAPYFTGGGSSYSPNTVPLLSPRYPQKVAGTLNGYNNLNLGPGPAPVIVRNGNVHTQPNNFNRHHPIPGGDNKGSSTSDKNKNLVLHLHVHRRNDVEMEAEASDHFMSTDKPSNNYK